MGKGHHKGVGFRVWDSQSYSLGFWFKLAYKALVYYEPSGKIAKCDGCAYIGVKKEFDTPQWIFQKSTRKTCLQPACITWANSQSAKHSERSNARKKEGNAEAVEGLMWEERLSKHSGSDVYVLPCVNTAVMNFDHARWCKPQVAINSTINRANKNK